MSEVVIKAQNVSKQYRLGQVNTGTLYQDVTRWWHEIRGKENPYLKIGEANDRTIKGESDYVWALQNINFDVHRGEVLGIIGRNGAGKSTLLKILSRTTQPTVGEIKMKGRVASLLEVGTGFHPELTGRENIFLNGAILGMRKAEIKRKFDDIVEFAGVQRYIDTPVKRYSSGMYVRLAFAVAAHLESEILIVDEVLAVGDSEFQAKCIGKMGEVGKQGRTVIYVSHQMATLVQLCEKAIWMDKGTLISKGETNAIIEQYLKSKGVDRDFYIADSSTASKKPNYISTQKMVDEDGEVITELTNNNKLLLEINIKVSQWKPNMEFAASLQHRVKGRIFTINCPLKDMMSPTETEKSFQIEIPANVITPNAYSWISALHVPGHIPEDIVRDECAFSIIDVGSEFARYDGADYGVIYLKNYQIKLVK